MIACPRIRVDYAFPLGGYLNVQLDWRENCKKRGLNQANPPTTLPPLFASSDTLKKPSGINWDHVCRHHFPHFFVSLVGHTAGDE